MLDQLSTFFITQAIAEEEDVPPASYDNGVTH